MNCQRPVKEESGKWVVWDFAYEEAGSRFYEKHEFWDFDSAIEFWKIRNPKIDEVFNKKLTLNEVLDWASNICDREESMSDKELEKECKIFFDYCSGKNPDCSLYFVTYERFFKMKSKRLGEKSIIDSDGNINLENFK